MAIEDTGLLNSAIEIQDNSVVKNEGKTTIEKSIAGVSDQEFFNQREKVNLQKEGYSNLEINKHQKTNTIFPITNSFNLFKAYSKAIKYSSEFVPAGSGILQILLYLPFSFSEPVPG